MERSGRNAVCLSRAEGGTGELKLSIDPNYIGALTKIVVRDSGDPVFKSTLTGSVKPPARYGYVFSGWFYDRACTDAVGADDVMTRDTDIFAGWAAWDEETAEWMDRVLYEAEQARYICNRPAAYTPESFLPYQGMATPVMFLTMEGGVFPRQMEGLIHALRGARERLQPADGVTDPEKTCWYIWGDDMPTEAYADRYSYYGTWDNPGFRPFLVPYLLEDQSRVKGNIILISGGEFYVRTNRWEAYPAVQAFQTLGYNCFVLQRRVAPSTPVDAALDLQRAIRYLKYNARQLGIGRIEHIACAGFSGGGGTIAIAVERLYGDIRPDSVYPHYTCDEIDCVNSDMDTMLLVYSAMPLNTENPNIPDAFAVIGTDDHLLWNESYEAMAWYRQRGVRYEAHFFSDAGHGFGTGFGLNSATFSDENIENVKVWPALADQFMSARYGYRANVTTIPRG